MFFVVWGRKGVVNVVSSGKFQCPMCNLQRAYELKEIRKYFTLFWIPLFPYGESIEYLECQCCKTAFDPQFFDINREKNVRIEEQQ